MKQADMKLAYKVGIWSASLATVLIVIAGITATAAIQPFATVVGFLVAPTFTVMMVCIYSTAPENRRFLGLIGLSFALIYGTLISFNYFVDLTFVRQGAFDVEVFNMLNTSSLFWVVEVLGYFFMGLATLFAAPIFMLGKLETAIRWLFVINGVLGIGGLIGYTLNVSISLLLGGLIVWDIVMPLSTALVAYRFKNKVPK
jgi:hypothetical protein